jgi:hypothetical protein
MEVEQALGPESTIKDLFERIAVPKGSTVVPIVIDETKTEARYLIVIQGEPRTATQILHSLMVQIEHMKEYSDHHEAVSMNLPDAITPKDEDEPRVISTD